MKLRVISHQILNYICFFINPLMSLPLNLYSTIKYKRNNLCLAMIFGMIGYFYNPTDVSDMYRIYTISFSYIKNLSLTDYIEFISGIKGDFLFYALSYLYIKSGILKNFIPFTTATIYYYGIIKLCVLGYRFYEKEKLKNLYFFVLLFHGFMFLSMLQYISNMRYQMALGLLSLGIISDLQKKRSGYIYYILSIMTHIALFPIVFAIVISNVEKIGKSMKKIFFISAFFSVISKNIYIFFLQLLAKVNINFVKGISIKLNSYVLNSDTASVALIYRGSMFVYLVLIFVITFNIKKDNRLIRIVSSMGAIAFFNLPFGEIFYRMSAATGLLGLVLLSYFLSRKNKFKNIVIIIILIIDILLLLAYIRSVFIWKTIPVNAVFSLFPFLNYY